MNFLKKNRHTHWASRSKYLKFLICKSFILFSIIMRGRHHLREIDQRQVQVIINEHIVLIKITMNQTMFGKVNEHTEHFITNLCVKFPWERIRWWDQEQIAIDREECPSRRTSECSVWTGLQAQE